MADCDVLIVGGGPAALSCAMTARKRNLSCRVISAPSSSSWLYRAEQIDNYPGMPAVSGKQMLAVMEQQVIALGGEIVHGMCRQLQPMGDEYMALVGNDIVMAKAIVLAMGAARPVMLPGEEELLGRGVSWCGTCDGMFYRGKKVAVLSAWNGGVEEAEFLSHLAASVDYYTMQPHDVQPLPNVTLREGKPASLSKPGSRIVLQCKDGTEEEYDGVFVFRPAVAPDKLLPGLELDGPFVKTDRRMSCSLPHVYACGDCTGKPLQIAKAVGEGNIAAISAAEDLAR